MAEKYTVGMCPSPIEDDSVEYDNRDVAISVRTSEGNANVEVYMCPNHSECHDGLFVFVKMCPTGETCGCSYSVDNLRWRDNGSCGIYFEWNNPDNCILRQVNLERISAFEDADLINWVIKYTHERIGELSPTLYIYPDGDPRNDEGCKGCGIGGEVEDHEPGSEEIYEVQNMIPGQLYRVAGYFDDLSCGGRETKQILGYVVYQTTGLTSGVIKSVQGTNPPLYEVEFYERDTSTYKYALKTVNLWSVDYYNWEVDDAVMLVKIETTFPNGYYTTGITHESVQQKSPSGDSDYKNYYFIVPYYKVEGR